MRVLHNLIFSPWQHNDVYANPASPLFPDTHHAKDILGEGFCCDALSVENAKGKASSELRLIHNLDAYRGDVAAVFFAGKGGTVLGNINESDTTLYAYDGEKQLLYADDVFPTRRQLIKDLQDETGLPVIAPILDRSGSFGKKVRNEQFAAILDQCQEKGIKTLHITGESMGANDALAFANYALEHKDTYGIAVGSVAMAVPFDTLANIAEAKEGTLGRVVTSMPTDRMLDNVVMLQEIYKKMHAEESVSFPLTILTAGEKDSTVPMPLQYNTLEHAKQARDDLHVTAPIHHIYNPEADHFLWNTRALAESVAQAEAVRLHQSVVPNTSVTSIDIKGIVECSRGTTTAIPYKN